MPSRVGPRCTVTSVGGTSAILMVLFSEAKIASDRSKPTFLASTSNAATNLTSRTWYWPELDVHQAGDGRVLVGVLVVLHALHQRGRAVADADNGDPHLGVDSVMATFSLSILPLGCLFEIYELWLWSATPCATRSAAIRSLSHFTSRSLDSSPSW